MLFTKSLWASLQVTLPRDSGQHILQILERSKPCPLQMILTIRPMIQRTINAPRIVAFRDSVFAESSRLRKLHISVLEVGSSANFHNILSWLEERHLTSLEYLHLERVVNQSCDITHTDLVRLQAHSLPSLTPFLRVLRLYGLCWDYWPGLSYGNLNILEMEWNFSASDADGLHKLEHCYALEELYLHFRSGEPPSTKPLDITFPSLKKLELYSQFYESCQTGADVLRRLSIPKLESLHVFCFHGGYQFFKDVLLQQDRSYPYLTSLRLDAEAPEASFASRLPALSELIISPDGSASEVGIRKRVRWAAGDWPEHRVLDMREMSRMYPFVLRCIKTELSLKRSLKRPKIILKLHPSACRAEFDEVWAWLADHTVLSCNTRHWLFQDAKPVKRHAI
jgi:hypothetical protein